LAQIFWLVTPRELGWFCILEEFPLEEASFFSLYASFMGFYWLLNGEGAYISGFSSIIPSYG